MHLNVVYSKIGNVYPNASVSINILITLQVIKNAVGTEKIHIFQSIDTVNKIFI